MEVFKISNFNKVKNNNKILINENIKYKEVFLIDVDGEKLGNFSSKDALREAQIKGLDIVCLSPNANPPVCKIMDYGKYLYTQQKKKKETKKKQKNLEIKEIRLSPTIDNHDLETKISKANKFLLKGDKVKISVRFRARAITHPEIGRDLLEKVIIKLSNVGQVEGKPNLEGYHLNIMIIPKKK